MAELEAIEEGNGLSNDQLDRKTWLLCENLKCLEQEEMYWFERSHQTWLLKGDNNTSYFHKCAIGRKRKKNIISLEKDGQVIEGDDKLLEHATEYYFELFGHPLNMKFKWIPLSGRMLQKSLQMITASYVGLLRKLKSKKLCGKWIQ